MDLISSTEGKAPYRYSNTMAMFHWCRLTSGTGLVAIWPISGGHCHGMASVSGRQWWRPWRVDSRGLIRPGAFSTASWRHRGRVYASYDLYDTIIQARTRMLHPLLRENRWNGKSNVRLFKVDGPYFFHYNFKNALSSRLLFFKFQPFESRLETRLK